MASREALHGIKWPATSPKILDVDYADDDEVGVAVTVSRLKVSAVRPE